MSRPIDADALKENVEGHDTSMSVCLSVGESYGMVTMKEQCIEDIDNAPTIDAIPIEWLKEKSIDACDPFSPYMLVMFAWHKWKEEQEAKE